VTYTLDTNILIGLIQRYPRDIFPSIWSALESSIDGGDVCICQDVLIETDRAGDDLFAWAKNYPGLACGITQEEVDLAGEISEAHPDWVRESFNAADPFLIAHASVESRTIVSEESKKGPGTIDRNQKVPNVAEEFGVSCVKFFDFARAGEWQF
jgi:hypothetical protein